MKLVYVAGPYRSPTPWGVEQNIRAAMDAAAQVWAAGLAAVCPHANAAHMSTCEAVATSQVWQRIVWVMVWTRAQAAKVVTTGAVWVVGMDRL